MNEKLVDEQLPAGNAGGKGKRPALVQRLFALEW